MSLKGDSPAIDLVVDESDSGRGQEINSGWVERRVVVPPETRPSSALSLTTPGMRPPAKLLKAVPRDDQRKTKQRVIGANVRATDR